MITCFARILFLSFLFSQQIIASQHVLSDYHPLAVVHNQNPNYSLINSVDFNPKEQLFCVTYTHINKIILYRLTPKGHPRPIQALSNPLSHLSEPQHAVFTPDGNQIVVANWSNETLTVYQKGKNSLFLEKPMAIIQSPWKGYKPHGISFSPCGNFLAIAYGAASYHPKAIALFKFINIQPHFELLHLFEGPSLPGIPKGITFSPNGKALLVTFSDTNQLVVFHLSKDKKRILQNSVQVIQGAESKISRPEDVKVLPSKNICAVSSSDQHRVVFFDFDNQLNRITENKPCDVLQNPHAAFYFPHGLAFSPDGSYLIVTEFGHVNTTAEGDIAWDSTVKPSQSKFSVYKVCN